VAASGETSPDDVSYGPGQTSAESVITAHLSPSPAPVQGEDERRRVRAMQGEAEERCRTADEDDSPPACWPHPPRIPQVRRPASGKCGTGQLTGAARRSSTAR